MKDVLACVLIILVCLGASTTLVVYSLRRINRVARMGNPSYRDIIGKRHGTA